MQWWVRKASNRREQVARGCPARVDDLAADWDRSDCAPTSAGAPARGIAERQGVSRGPRAERCRARERWINPPLAGQARVRSAAAPQPDSAIRDAAPGRRLPPAAAA